MKKIIYISVLFFLVTLQTSVSQTYVDDVERVELVIIDYCVDEKGERYDIVVNGEKTTYLGKGWHKSCLEHFKKSELFHPMKMKDNCWDYVYFFVNPTYKTQVLSEADKKKCKTFHKGTFKYENIVHNDVTIVRKKHKQIEGTSSKDQRQVYELNWLDDHIYTLKTIKLPLEQDKHNIGNVIHVEIIEVIDENSYMYKSYIEGNDNRLFYGIIRKVSN